MITNPRVFDDRHLPRELMHREAEVESLHRAWAPVRDGEAAEEVLLSGPSGVGKTALARYTLERVRSETGLQSAYVPCLGATPVAVLRSILEDYPGATAPDDRRDVDALEGALREAVDEPIVVVLDEAEGLPTTAVLDRLGRVPRCSTVVICHDPHEWLARLSTGADRYLGATKLSLDRYGVDELADILEARARAGLREGVIGRSQLEWIADEVAGVARYGIQTLRAAAERAAEEGHATITERDIDAAFATAERDIRRQNIRSLAFHHHILYALIYQAGRITAEELHARYDQVAEQVYDDVTVTPIVRRTRRNRLRKLQDYDLIATEGRGAGRAYTVVDGGVEPPIAVGLEV